MATYRLRRKTFGMADAGQRAAGGAMEGIGKTMDSNLGGVAGGIAGAATVGSAIGAGLGSAIGSVVPVVGTAIGGTVGGALGTGLGYMAGSKVTRGVGQALTESGQDLQAV